MNALRQPICDGRSDDAATNDADVVVIVKSFFDESSLPFFLRPQSVNGPFNWLERSEI